MTGNFRILAAAFTGMTLLAAPAHAHMAEGAGTLGGLLHPLTGPDHLLAMILVGIYTVQSRTRPALLLPACFLFLLAIGGWWGISLSGAPVVETGIAISVLVLGLAVAFAIPAARAAALVAVGCFALFHGVAHGAEMPAGANPLTYFIGFVAATALLHAAGIAIASLAQPRPGHRNSAALRLVGGCSAAIGGGMLAGMF